MHRFTSLILLEDHWNPLGLITVRLALYLMILIPVASAAQSDLLSLRRSVVSIRSAESLCTGVLLNNTREDGRVLVLSARHCFSDDFGFISFTFGRDNLLENADIQAHHWETSTYQILAQSKDLDFVLFELTGPVPESIRPFYAGWNANAVLPIASYSYHIQEGTIELNEDIDSPCYFTLEAIRDFGGAPVENGSFWIKRWENGFTATGSSGAPLFNQESQVIGTLSAGASTETDPVDDFYSRFDLMFFSGDENLGDFLAPSSISFMQGMETLGKIQNYARESDILGRLRALEMTEFFRVDQPVVVEGLFLPVHDVIPTDLVQITLSSSQSSLTFSAFSGDLLAHSENYLQLPEPLTVVGDLMVSVTANNSLEYLQVSSEEAIGSMINGNFTEGSSMMIGLLTSSPTQVMFEEEAAYVVYPNPTRGSLFVEGISERDDVVFYDLSGKLMEPEFTIDYKGRFLFDFRRLDQPFIILHLPSSDAQVILIDR